MSTLPYYFVCRLPTGRWAVAHRVAATGLDSVDVDCATLHAAQVEASWMNAEHARAQQRLADERALCGVRA